MLAALLPVACACAREPVTVPTTTGDTPPLSASDIEAIAENAYIYAYPMMENYRTMFTQIIDPRAPGTKSAFNQLVHNETLLGPDFKDVVRPNNDTMYSFAWLDLRAEPVVISVPKIDDRYYSIQLIDMFTHNFAYIGTRTTGVEEGRYVVAGPDWSGTMPKNTDALFRSDSEFVYCIVRTEVRGPEDVAAVRQIQEGYEVTPLHASLGRSRAPQVSGITFPAYDASKAMSPGFIDLLNFLLSHVSTSEETELMQRFSRIGIRPGATSASLGFNPMTRGAIDAGVQRAILDIAEAAENPTQLDGVRTRVAEGWQGVDGLFGSGAEMRGKYLVRAVAAKLGLYGNDSEEAYYPLANTDGSGEPLNGTKHAYVIRFDEDEIPPVEAFWSMTMYGLPDQLMVENRIDRYSIGDRSKLKFAEDGSLRIYIQHRSPGRAEQSNWLPAPDGPFSLQLRMYLPKEEALDTLYLPPPVRVRR
jgi:hypothetical protein